MALANYCAFYGAGDVGTMERMMRDSALVRDKWDKVHGGESGRTYLQMTLDAALADWNGEGYTLEAKQVSAAKVGSKSAPAPTPTTLNKDDYESTYLTERANAQRLYDHFGDTVAFTTGLGWFIYDANTGIFENDAGAHKVRKAASDALQTMLRSELAALVEASAQANEDELRLYDKLIRLLHNFIKSSSSRRAIEKCL